MWQVLIAGLRSYAPWVTLPFAVVVGAVGYTVERTVRGDKAEPVRLKSVVEEREERQLAESMNQDCTKVDSLKEKKGIPKTVLSRNEISR